MTPTQARKALRQLPHGQRRSGRRKVSDALHARLADEVKRSPHPLDQAARCVVEGV